LLYVCLSDGETTATAVAVSHRELVTSVPKRLTLVFQTMLTKNFNQTFDNSKEYLLIYLLLETSLLIKSVINKRSLWMLAKLY